MIRTMSTALRHIETHYMIHGVIYRDFCSTDFLSTYHTLYSYHWCWSYHIMIPYQDVIPYHVVIRDMIACCDTCDYILNVIPCRDTA